MDSEVKSLLHSVEKVFVATSDVVKGMSDGDRMAMKDLANTVALAVGKPSKDVLAYVHAFVHDTKAGHVSKGPKGGFVKGEKSVKVAKVVKPAKPKLTVVLNETDSNDNKSV